MCNFILLIPYASLHTLYTTLSRDCQVFSVINLAMCEKNVEVLQTLITTALCFFQPFYTLGYYGTSWYSMVYSFRSIVFTELVALRPK